MYIFQKIIPQIYEPGFQMELKTQISFMQARELRIATKRFKMSFLEANELFGMKQYFQEHLLRYYLGL